MSIAPVLPPTARSATGRQFLALDALRGLAAALVIERHTAHAWGGWHFFHSFLAVDMFFVLSGFVICSAYDAKLRSKQLSVREFLWVRLIRLYPVYFLGACLGFLALLLETEHPGFRYLARSFLMTLFFVPSPDHALFPLNFPFWSLFFELIINFAVALLAQIRGKYWMPALAVLCAVTFLTLAAIEKSVDAGWLWGATSLLFGISRAGFGILAGYLACQWTTHKNLGTDDARILTPVLLVAVGCLVLPDVGAWEWIVSSVIILAVFPGVVLAASTLRVPSSLRYGFELLGEASYPLYALHVPLAALLLLGLGGHLDGRGIGSSLLLLSTLSTVAVLISRVYDRPVRQCLTQWILRRKSAVHNPLEIETFKEKRARA